VVVRGWNSEIQARHERHDDYTGSGLWRVKPYVQFGIGIMWREICPRGGSRRRSLEGAPGRLILAGVRWVTSWFLSILLGYNMESLSKLDYLSCTPCCLHVFGPTSQVGRGPRTGRQVF
jgi:hypothetical protein